MKKIPTAIINFILNYPKRSILFSCLVLLVLSAGIIKFKADFSYRIWFGKNDQHLKAFDKFESKFGNDDEVAILINSPSGVFDKETINLILNMTKDMWKVTDIIRVDSMTNYDRVHGDSGQLIIEPLISSDKAKLSPDYIQDRKKIALSDKILVNSLLSKDGKTALVVAKLRPSTTTVPDYTQILKEVRQVVSKYQYGDHKFYITGSPVIDQAFSEVTKSDLQKIFPFLFGIIILFLLFTFRTAIGVLFPFLIMMASILVTFGVAGLLGIRFNALTSTIPNIMLSVSIVEAVHFLSIYYQKIKAGWDKKEAIRQTYTANFFPTFLTSLTTAIGFLTLMTSDVVPIANMGILAGIGIMIIWLLTIFLLGPILLLLPSKKSQSKKPTSLVKESDIYDEAPHPYVLKYLQILKIFRWPVAIFSLIFSIGAFWLASQNQIISNPFQAFRDDVPIKQAANFMQKNMGGSMGFDIVVDSGKENGVKDPVFLHKVEAYQNWLNHQPYVAKTLSVVDILKSVNRAFNQNQPSEYKIINSQKGIAEQLFLYTMSLPPEKDINHLITYDQGEMRITGRWALQDSKQILQTAKLFEQKAKEFGLNVQVSGKTILMNQMMEALIRTFLVSVFSDLIFITLIMIIVGKSLKLGLLSMIPNLVPLAAVLAFLKIIHQPLDIGSVMVVSICLGIVVDDTIHLLTHYFHYRKEGVPAELALAKILTFNGPALIITTMILVLGFGSFVFASFIPNVHFGMAVSFTLILAMVMEVMLTPAILMTIDSK